MLPPGEKVTLEVWREGKVSQVSATLGAMDKVADAGSKAKGVETSPRLGLTVGPIEPKAGTGASANEGLLVHEATGAAAAAGVRPGDVLLSVDGSKVKKVEDVKNALKDAGKSVALLVQRGEARIFVPVPLG